MKERRTSPQSVNLGCIFKVAVIILRYFKKIEQYIQGKAIYYHTLQTEQLFHRAIYEIALSEHHTTTTGPFKSVHITTADPLISKSARERQKV
jgi:hypothetical protein